MAETNALDDRAQHIGRSFQGNLSITSTPTIERRLPLPLRSETWFVNISDKTTRSTLPLYHRYHRMT
jgi:hypothetical protein